MQQREFKPLLSYFLTHSLCNNGRVIVESEKRALAEISTDVGTTTGHFAEATFLKNSHLRIKYIKC